MSATRRPPTLSSPRHRTGTSSLLGRSSLTRCKDASWAARSAPQRGLAAHDGACGTMAVQGTWLTQCSHGSGSIGPSTRDGRRHGRFRSGFQLFGSTLFRRLCGGDKCAPRPHWEANNRTREVGRIPDHHGTQRRRNLDAVTIPDAAARLAPYAGMNMEGRHICMLPRIHIAGTR
jgi:hypothetical protein